MSENQELFTWMEEQLQALGIYPKALECRALTGDAGFRRYWRLNTVPKLLAVYAPVETEDVNQFIRVADWLKVAGVHAPSIVAQDLSRGFLLVEDLGTTMLGEALNDDSVHGLYGEALNVLLHIQTNKTDLNIFPVYDEALLKGEMALFSEWFLTQLLGLELSKPHQAMLAELMTLLVNEALAQTQVTVHRDFHSRNIVLMDSPELGVIDFQDAVIGPLTYDLVSLLKDCYVEWPQVQVEAWALAYAAMARDAGLLENVSSEQFLQQFHWMGLQRHIKVLGIFARLSLRDGKHAYLHDLSLVFKYVLESAQRYEALAPFMDFLQTEVAPVFNSRFWVRK